MPTSAEYRAGIDKAVVNMERLDGFVNGDATTVVNTDNGSIPSLAKVVQDTGWEAGAADTAVAAAEEATTQADRAEDAAATAIASIDGNRLSNTIALISQAQSFDANSLTIPNRDGRAGTMLDLNPAVPSYLLGAFNGPSGSALKCVRASSGTAIGGGASETFTVDTPRIIGGKIFRDAGGTNPMVASGDISDAAWIKTGLATVTSVAGEAGTTSAKRIAETNTGSAQTHVLRNNVTVASNTDFFAGAIVNADRGYLQFDMFNSNGTSGVRSRFDLTGNGSVISPYPAALGSGATNLTSGVVKLASGLFFVWVACTMPTSQTALQFYLYAMSNSTTTSYIGDTSKGLIVESAWVTPGSRTPVYAISATTRAAESLSIPLLKGAYIEQASDGVNNLSSAFLLSSSEYRAPTFPSWIPWLTRYRLYTADAYDIFDRANTSPGSIGTASDGGSYTLFNGYAGSYPLPTATTGQIASNWVTLTPTSGSTGTVYAVRDLGGPVAFASVRIRFGAAISGGGAVTNTSVALLASNDITRLVETMPIHLVATRSGLNIQKRLTDGTFVDLGFIGARLAVPVNTEHAVSFEKHGSVMRVSVGNLSVVVSDSALADPARYICWEINTTGSNTNDNAQFKDCFASRALVGDTPVFVAAAPVVTEAAFVSPSSPATYTSGCTLSVLPQPALVNSNSGPITITAYQWYRNGVLISGATAATHVTTAGTDSGATFFCAITYTNNTGSTVGNSITTPALA